MPRFSPDRSQLASPQMKKRWTVAYAQAVVGMAVSGLSVREFAEAAWIGRRSGSTAGAAFSVRRGRPGSWRSDDRL